MSTPKLGLAVKMGLAFWLLLAPGENWTWVIVGGHEMQHACEQARNDRLDGDYLVCASTPAWTAARPASADKPAGPGDRGPSPSLGMNVGDIPDSSE
jgi:hypothetical protein